MNRAIFGVCVVGLATAGVFPSPKADAARNAGRQYYAAWRYNEINRYHYRQYYYLPTTAATTYSYHYVIYYPAQPRYYYYYNPAKRRYWGRYDLEKKGYSLLAEADQKEKLEDVGEKAFPAPAKMPNIPEATDEVAMEIPPSDAPKDEK